MDTLLELTSKAEPSHFWFRGFRKFVTPLLERAAGGRADLTILDCGCGTGNNLRQLGRYGTAFGVDMAASGLALARRAGRPLARADVAGLPFRSTTFDIVTSFDVLQCVPDDDRAIAEIARVLKPGGRFVGTVAALPLLHGDHSLLSEEVRRYTRRSVSRLLAGGGLEPVLVRYAFASLFPALLGVRVAQRIRGSRASGTEITVPIWPVNSLLTMMVSAEAALGAHVPMPIGSSLIFLARKN